MLVVGVIALETGVGPALDGDVVDEEGHQQLGNGLVLPPVGSPLGFETSVLGTNFQTVLRNPSLVLGTKALGQRSRRSKRPLCSLASQERGLQTV